MKSNYPRSVEDSRSVDPPKILPYSVGLGLVIYLVGQIYVLTESSSNIFGLTLPRLDSDFVFLPALLVASLGVVLVWKCSRWRVRDKAKMIGLTTILMHVIAFALMIVSRWPDVAGTVPQYGLFVVVTLYMAAMLTAACSVIWILAALLHRKPKNKSAPSGVSGRVQGTYAENLDSTRVIASEEEGVVRA